MTLFRQKELAQAERDERAAKYTGKWIVREQMVAGVLFHTAACITKHQWQGTSGGDYECRLCGGWSGGLKYHRPEQGCHRPKGTPPWHEEQKNRKGRR